MRFGIAATSRVTGNILRTLVAEKAAEQGVRLAEDAVVCYGVGQRGTRVLNGNCSAQNKLEQARALQEGLGPGALEVVTDVPSPFVPLLSRKIVHSRGRDIGVVLEPWQVAPRLASGADFFTKYVPSVREFRVWIYRKRHLGTYEKVLRRPEVFTRLGRNFANGFDFSKLDNDSVPQNLKDICIRAISVLDLDFGAVDLIQREDGSYCVLEVNTAPGVSDSHRAVIQQLAKRIVRWAANGYPERTANGQG